MTPVVVGEQEGRGRAARAHSVLCGSMSCVCDSPASTPGERSFAGVWLRGALRRWLGLRLGAPRWYVLAVRGCVCAEPVTGAPPGPASSRPTTTV